MACGLLIKYIASQGAKPDAVSTRQEHAITCEGFIGAVLGGDFASGGLGPFGCVVGLTNPLLWPAAHHTQALP